MFSLNSASEPKEAPDLKANVFGKYRTDHFFMARFTPKRLWHDQAIKSYNDFHLDLSSSSLQFGLNLFDSVRVRRSFKQSLLFFRPDAVFERFSASAIRIGFPTPDYDLFLSAISSLARNDVNWIPPSPEGSLYLRCNIFLDEQTFGARHSPSVFFSVISSPLITYGRGPISVLVAEKPRSRMTGFGNIKIGANYSINRPAVERAKHLGFQQLLWLDDTSTYVEELNALNIFFVLKDQIITPRLNGNIIPGVIRDSVIQILTSWELNVVERDIKVDSLKSLYEQGHLMGAFGVGTATLITMIDKIKYQEMTFSFLDRNSFEIERRLYNCLLKIQTGESDDFPNWGIKY